MCRNIMMKCNKRTIILLPLLMVNIFFSHNTYSFHSNAILERNFGVCMSLVCVAGLFCLLGHFYCRSTKTVHYIKVPRQTGAYCGFHAVKNVKLLLENDTTDKTDLEKAIQKAGFPELEEWCEYTQKEFKVKSWLNNREVKKVALNKAEIKDDRFTIIQNIADFSPVQVGASGYHLANVLRQLNTNNGFKHAFITGNMKECVGARGHWVGILAQREDDQIHYYITDSLNEKNSFWAKKLSKIFSDEMVTKIEWAPEFNHILDSIQGCLHNPELRATEEERVTRVLKYLQELRNTIKVLIRRGYS